MVIVIVPWRKAERQQCFLSYVIVRKWKNTLIRGYRWSPTDSIPYIPQGMRHVQIPDLATSQASKRWGESYGPLLASPHYLAGPQIGMIKCCHYD